LWRVLKGGGTLVATVPLSARAHHEPFDYQRFTQYGLERLLARFTEVRISPRGTDLVSIAAKMVVVGVRLARPQLELSLVWRIPLLVVAAPGLIVAIALGHTSLAFNLGSKTDPLGFSITCVK